MSAADPDLPALLKYGRIEIQPALRQAGVDGTPVPLGGRAFDLLLLLARHADRPVTKDEIFRQVWPGVVVEDNNLSVQISALRKALGPDAITTISGRGYQFTPPPAGTDPTTAHAAAPPAHLSNLPARAVTLYGRDEALAEVMAALAASHCVTLCGMAGIGKTSLARLAAQRLAAQRRHAHGAWCVDLTEVREPRGLARALGNAIGFDVEDEPDAVHTCVAQLRHRELLLILDNCEHLIDAAAAFVAELLARAPQVQVLATSQEPLRVEGEQVLRLSPLEVPADARCADAAQYGAVRLLLERVCTAMGGRFEPSADDLEHLIEICRQLDGIPLALEFAASRIPLLGPAGVRARLHDRLRLLAGGPRTAAPRHRSLQAALEWSHQLLSPHTRHVLHRLAVFPSGFSLEGAELLLGEPGSELIEHLNVLVDRSLVTRVSTVHDSRPARPRYRLLETTRAFALDSLAHEADGIDWQQRFALAMRELCRRGARERDTGWLLQEMPNARAALGWALAAPGHAETAVSLATTTSVVLGANGAIAEALGNLQRVQHLVTGALPEPLRARYWHWLGRLGVEGRLPTSSCIEYLQRADAMFRALGESKHRHGCQRHLAEAQLRAGRLQLAEQHLQVARELEAEQPRASDRVRRLRVEALLAAARGDHAQALLHAQTALPLAEAHGFDPYRLLLLTDIAWSHLQMGNATAAVTGFQDLLTHLTQPNLRFGLARARTLSGLTAGLVAAGRVDDAAQALVRTAQALRDENLMRSRFDIFAWVAAAAGAPQAAARFIGVADEFAARTETQRDPISVRARQQALALIATQLPDPEMQHWLAQGRQASDLELLHLFETLFAPPPLPSPPLPEPSR